MKLIIDLLGKQSEQDLSFLTEDLAKDFVKKLDTGCEATNMHDRFTLKNT